MTSIEVSDKAMCRNPINVLVLEFNFMLSKCKIRDWITSVTNSVHMNRSLSLHNILLNEAANSRIVFASNADF
jgi:hypothetical protein